MMMRGAAVLAACSVAGALACAGASHGTAGSTKLTSVDTAWYVVPGSSRAEWAVNMPRAAAAAGIPGGHPSWTGTQVTYSMGRTRTTAIGCEVEGSVTQLRFGHVMPKLAPDARPSDAERAAWDSFMQRLWTGAHEREAIGAKVLDELRADMKRTRTSQCSELLVQNRQKFDEFGARYAEAVRRFEAEQRASGAFAPSPTGMSGTP